MNIYPYPSLQKKTVIDKAVTHLFYLTFVILLYQKYYSLVWIIGAQWLVFIFGEVKDYWQRNQGWLAKRDNEFVYLYKPTNKIPLTSISEIERQTIGGKKLGINIICKNGRVRSEQFPMLNDQQIDELVQFLNHSISAK